MLKIIAKLEFAIFIAAFWMISAGIMGFYVKLFAGAPPLPIEIIHFPIMIGMVGVIALRIRESVFGLLSVLPYFFLMIFAVASYRWSLNPAFTFREAVTALVYVVYIGTLCWRYSWKELVEGLWVAMLSMSVISILLFVLMPSVGKMGAPHPGALAGVWMEKNATGQAGAFGACLALARFAISPRTFFSSMISFFIFTVLLLLSTSKTSLVAYIVGCLSFGWVFMMRRNLATFMATTWMTLIGGGFLAYFIKNNTDTVLGLLGRSSTFTGRSEIWQSVKMSLADRPLLGHGYSGYWDLEVYGKTLSYVFEDLDYLPRHSHNSLIEMQLNLGLVGAAILVLTIAIYLVVALMRVRSNHGAYFVLPFTFAALIVGSFESVLAYPSNFAGAVMVMAAGKMVRPALQSEARSGLWTAIRAFGARGNSVPNQAPMPATGFQAPRPAYAPAPLRDRRAPKRAGFRPLPHIAGPVPMRPAPVKQVTAGFKPVPFEPAEFRLGPRQPARGRKGFGRKPKGLANPFGMPPPFPARP